MKYRIESEFDLDSDWLPKATFSRVFNNKEDAVATAIEGVVNPESMEVRVVSDATGEVVWRSTDNEFG